jgi:type II secretory pathway pseudopilin PulG
LLTVIGILALLIGILLPVVLAGIRTAERARASADLQAIATALEAYHGEFGDYPRSSKLDPPNNIAGSQLLVHALIAPYPQAPTTPADPSDDFVTDFYDGAANLGFRKRPGGQGQVYGPYLPLDKFTFSNTQLFDRFGKPILYIPARPTTPVLTASNSFVDGSSGALYDSRYLDAGTLTETELRYMLGDLNTDGKIDTGEVPAFTGKFLIWGAGPDTDYGPATPLSGTNAARCDDVTNFR